MLHIEYLLPISASCVVSHHSFMVRRKSLKIFSLSTFFLSPLLPLHATNIVQKGNLHPGSVRYKIVGGGGNPPPCCVLSSSKRWAGCPSFFCRFILCIYKKTMHVGRYKVRAYNLARPGC